jgi:hypothetical protein
MAGAMWDDVASSGMSLEQVKFYLGERGYSATQNIVHGSTFPIIATISSCIFLPKFCLSLAAGSMTDISSSQKNEMLLKYFSIFHVHVGIMYLLSILLICFIVYNKYLNINLSIATYSIGITWPSLSGHGMFNSVDLPILFGFACVWAHHVFNHNKIKEKSNFLVKFLESNFLFIIGSVFIIGTRPPLFVFVILISVSIILVNLWKGNPLSQIIKKYLFNYAIVLLIFSITNPYFIYFFLNDPMSIINATLNFPSGGLEMFMDMLYSSSRLPSFYYVTIFLAYIPDLYLLSIISFILLIAYNFFKSKKRITLKIPDYIEFIHYFYIFLLPLLAILIIKPNLYNNGRQLLFMFLPILIFLVSSINYLVNKLNKIYIYFAIFAYSFFLAYLNDYFSPYTYTLRNFISYQVSPNLLSHDYWGLSLGEFSKVTPEGTKVYAVRNNFPNPYIYFDNLHEINSEGYLQNITDSDFNYVSRFSINPVSLPKFDFCKVSHLEQRNFLGLIHDNYGFILNCRKTN